MQGFSWLVIFATGRDWTVLTCLAGKNEDGMGRPDDKIIDGTIKVFFFSTGHDMHVCPPGHGMFHVITEAGHANLCGVVGCFRGEKPPLREVGSPEQSRRHLRRPLAQPRPSAAPQKKLRPSQTRVFIPLLCTCPCVIRILQNNTKYYSNTLCTAGHPGGLVVALECYY